MSTTSLCACSNRAPSDWRRALMLARRDSESAASSLSETMSCTLRIMSRARSWSQACRMSLLRCALSSSSAFTRGSETPRSCTARTAGPMSSLSVRPAISTSFSRVVSSPSPPPASASSSSSSELYSSHRLSRPATRDIRPPALSFPLKTLLARVPTDVAAVFRSFMWVVMEVATWSIFSASFPFLSTLPISCDVVEAAAAAASPPLCSTLVVVCAAAWAAFRTLPWA
mmetsp:Transcript_78300/g.127000  ORF Transcript_78300/g.127000 Transcript_78300/m.127000 type:complete len:228 (-) Transcript_78300:359-1042(-)